MTQRTKPPFRADHVGSILRPQSLLDERNRAAKGEITAEALRKLEDEAIRSVVKYQEDLGLQVVTDGEYRRTSWARDFMVNIGNVQSVATTSSAMKFRTESGETGSAMSSFHVAGKVSRPKTGIFVEDFKFLKSVATKATPKITVPSPSLLHFRGGRKAVDEKAYPEMDGFFADIAKVYQEELADLAAAGCRYFQIDETDFAYLCDPKLREEVRQMGEDPEKLPHTYAKLINSTIVNKPADMVVGMHVCRGNGQSAWVAEGGYDAVAEVMFNEIKVDAYFLEYDDRRSGGFEPLRFVPKGKFVVLGLVTTKRGGLESKDELKRRIEEAAKFCALDQLCLSPQCGFASAAPGNKLSVDEQTAKIKLILDVSREVWG